MNSMREVYVNSLITVYKQEINLLRCKRDSAKSKSEQASLDSEIIERNEALLSLLRGISLPRFS